jgi:N utilization substance protein B
MSGFGGVGSRREARERALSLLYEAEAKAETPDQVLDSLPMAPEAFAADLVSGVGDHRAQIDGLISRFAKGWTIERMPTIDRTLLRIGTYELAHRPDVPTGAVISEAVELAKRYSTDDSGKFVNGLLARIAREVRPHEPPSASKAVVVAEDEAHAPPPRGLDLAIGAPPEGFEVELVPGDEPDLDDGAASG